MQRWRGRSGRPPQASANSGSAAIAVHPLQLRPSVRISPLYFPCNTLHISFQTQAVDNLGVVIELQQVALNFNRMHTHDLTDAFLKPLDTGNALRCTWG